MQNKLSSLIKSAEIQARHKTPSLILNLTYLIQLNLRTKLIFRFDYDNIYILAWGGGGAQAHLRT